MKNVLSDDEKVVLLCKRLLGNYTEWKGAGEVKNLSRAIFNPSNNQKNELDFLKK
jgi:hypothetical protein